MDHPWKGTFSAEGGFYYWRNLTDTKGRNRLLLGGGRHQFPETEYTDEFGVPKQVVEHLESLARNQLQVKDFKTAMTWSGILGIGTEGKGLPIIKEEQPGVFYGVRMGGMGVALSAGVGRKLAELVVSRIA
jgi:glycine/D-amino acid oxidase-like deaminating enzyme